MRGPSTRAARPLLALAGVLLFWSLFFGGANGTDRLVWIGGAALVVAAAGGAAVLLGLLPRPALGAPGLLFVACYAGLVLWHGLSILWSVQPDRSWDYVNRGLVYLAFLFVGMFLATLTSRRAVATGLAVLLALLLGYSLLGKVVPSLYPDYARLARLRSPVGYWNALALLGDMALVLGLWRASRRRIDGTLLVFASTLVILLAYSRGGVVVAVVAAAAWLVLDRRRLESLTALALGGAAGIAVAGVSLVLSGITSDRQPHSVRAHDGLVFLLAIVAAGAIVAVLAWRAARIEPEPETRRRATLALLGGLGVACVAGIAGVALHAGPSATVTPAGSHCVQSAGRLACPSSDARLEWWKESWRNFADRPALGSGAGSFGLAHQLRRTTFAPPTDEPHNLALQALGETGIVGFALLAGAVLFAVVALRRRAREDGASVALAICALAYLLHALIDIDYDFVAVSAPFFLVLGVLLARRGPVLERREPVWALGVAALSATGILSLAAPYVAEQKITAAINAPSLVQAAALAHQGHAWNPVSIDPLETEAAIEESLHHKLQALALYHQAVDTQPDNPEAYVQLGAFELRTMHDACSAYTDLNQAYTLDRFNPVIAKKGGPLDVARAKVNAGACGSS